MLSINAREAMLRRWYVMLAGLLLTIGGTVAASILFPPQHELTANILLIPPKITDSPQPGTNTANPYLQLGGLDTMVGILGRSLTTPEQADRFYAAGAVSDYKVEADPTMPSAVLVVTVDGDTKDQAATTLRQILQAVPGMVESLQVQVGTPTKAMITSTVINEDQVGVVKRTSQLRVLVVVAGGGITSTVFAAVLIELLAVRRRARREAGAVLPEPPVASGPGQPVGPLPPVGSLPDAPATVARSGVEGMRVPPSGPGEGLATRPGAQPTPLIDPQAWIGASLGGHFVPQRGTEQPLQRAAEPVAPTSIGRLVPGPVGPPDGSPVGVATSAAKAANGVNGLTVGPHGPRGVNGGSVHGGLLNGRSAAAANGQVAPDRGAGPEAAPSAAPARPFLWMAAAEAAGERQAPPQPASVPATPADARPAPAVQPLAAPSAAVADAALPDGSGAALAPAAEEQQDAPAAAPHGPAGPPTGGFERLIKGKGKGPDNPRAAAHRLS